MTESEKAMLHVSVLQALKAAGDVGRPEERLLTDARMAGFDLTLPALQSELRTVADKNWITAFSPIGVKRYRVTELGKSVLVEAGL
jgi:hypothetical protein